MTTISAQRRSDQAVLFDLSGTTVDESFIRYGIAQAATDLEQRWGIPPAVTLSVFMPTFRAVSAEYTPRRFYLMREVICDTLFRIIGETVAFSRITGLAADCVYEELIEIETRMWTAAIPRAEPVAGALDTIRALQAAGIRTGIVSYSDERLFHGLLEQTGLAGAIEIALCSETARCCKPHTEIFLRAAAILDVAPADVLFVGDDVENDIVGANRAGMSTALVSPGEFTLADHDMDDSMARPDYALECLSDVIDVIVGDLVSGSAA